MYIFLHAMRGAPKFSLRSERAFEEIARAWRASLLWKALHQFVVGHRCATSEIRLIVVCAMRPQTCGSGAQPSGRVPPP